MKYLMLWIGFMLSWLLVSQNINEQVNTQLELSQSNGEDQANMEYLAEIYTELRQNPIKINFANAEELAQLGLLNIFQISNLLQYRKQTGAIYTHYELAMIKGFDRSLIEELKPYLDFTTERVLPKISWRDISRSRHEIILRYDRGLQMRAGYRSSTSAGYLGPPYASYFRYRGKVKDLIHFGFSAQKDAGEALISKNNPMLFDHASMFVALKGFGPVRYWVVGDYQVSFSQGLSIWSGGGMGGPGSFAAVKKYSRGISAYAGAEETQFLRGSAIDLKLLPALNLRCFLSFKPIDARLPVGSQSDLEAFTGALITTGLHRTEAELRNKHTNQLLNWGGQVKWRRKNLSLAINTVHYQFRKPIPIAANLYALHRFSGSKLINHSIEANLFWLKYNFFLELASDHNLRWAGIAGVESLLADGFHFSISLRYIDLKYQSFHSSLPSQTSASGERGIHLGLDWEVGSKWRLYFSSGHFQSPWLSYRLDAPASANQATMKLIYTPKRALNLQVLLRVRKDQHNLSSKEAFNQIIQRNRMNIRADLRYQQHSQLWFSWRIEKSMVESEERSTTLLIYQDIGFSFEKLSLDLKARVALIDGSDYTARIYAYESDLLYKFSIPAYYGQALRTYLILKWQASKDISFQSKIGLTSFFDRTIISSGLQQINGRHISNFSFQIRMKI